MKIDFKKVSQNTKKFNLTYNSVSFFGTFAKLSLKLIDVKSSIIGKIEVQCYRCGNNFNKDFNENVNFLLSNGVYSSNDEKNFDKIVIEIDNNLINFEEILQSEIESFKSDYHLCDNCFSNNSTIEIKY